MQASHSAPTGPSAAITRPGPQHDLPRLREARVAADRLAESEPPLIALPEPPTGRPHARPPVPPQPAAVDARRLLALTDRVQRLPGQWAASCWGAGGCHGYANSCGCADCTAQASRRLSPTDPRSLAALIISVSKVYPSKWIRPDEVTRAFTIVVTGVTVEEFRLPDGSKETKIVLVLARAAKRLPLSKTQAKALAGLLGDDAETWQGSMIILAPALAPNRKATIAVGVPENGGQITPGATIGEEPCETCGQTGGQHPQCPEA